ncbi:hypothetical protein Cgig2_013003 [Carnegiea gigantea]|uniref:Uncharacterized protein n=1 Tax=Carnegiea gigantea TaxID=171969 RepID=A0A9Q1K9Y0_9CARY|nr:hypothetical protein Cgig2_013003 [Carnegiea gigantea]
MLNPMLVLLWYGKKQPAQYRTFKWLAFKISLLVVQLNKAQTEAVRSMGFAFFLKVDLKQIYERFLKWLVDNFDPYSICFKLPYGQKFLVTAFDVYVTLGVPIGGRKIIDITKSSMDEEYDKNQHLANAQMMNKGQEGHVGLGNVERERSDKLKIKRMKVNQFNNRMPPKRL